MKELRKWGSNKNKVKNLIKETKNYKTTKKIKNNKFLNMLDSRLKKDTEKLYPVKILCKKKKLLYNLTK